MAIPRALSNGRNKRGPTYLVQRVTLHPLALLERLGIQLARVLPFQRIFQRMTLGEKMAREKGLYRPQGPCAHLVLEVPFLRPVLKFICVPLPTGRVVDPCCLLLIHGA